MPDEPIPITDNLPLTPKAIEIGVVKATQIMAGTMNLLIPYLTVDPEKMEDQKVFDEETKDFWCLYKYNKIVG